MILNKNNRISNIVELIIFNEAFTKLIIQNVSADFGHQSAHKHNVIDLIYVVYAGRGLVYFQFKNTMMYLSSVLKPLSLVEH